MQCVVMFGIQTGIAAEALQTSAENTTTIPTLKIDASDTTRPWTNLNLNNSPRNFQFAIVTDRTGGVRDGIFEDAIRKLNLLQPEFVMSVGDLISGYTQKPDLILQEWKEFFGLVARLKMPFFFVPGNHDLSNAVEHKFWEQLVGKKYYFFTYGDVLFLCLNSDDPTAKIGDEQIAYFDKVLKDHTGVRWTLVFLHRPLWVGDTGTFEQNPATYDGTGWGKFEQLLQGRPYTVFAGHLHAYTKQVRHDRNYITLATTGGGSALRGAENYGEFDHVAWVTMTDEGPVLANLALSGIWDENLRTTDTARLVAKVLHNSIEADPVITDPVPFTSATTQLRLTNDADIPLKLKISFESNPLLEVSPAAIEKTLQPNSVDLVDVSVTAPHVNHPLQLQNNPLRLHWSSVEEPEGIRKIELSGERAVEVFSPFICPTPATSIQVDGNLEEWTTLPLAMRSPRQTDGKKRWGGARDASADFAVTHDDKFLYVGAKVRDNILVTSTSATASDGDGLEIWIRGAGETTSEPETVGGNKKLRKNRAIRAHKPGAEVILLTAKPGQPVKLPHGIHGACVQVPGGYAAEFAVPLASLKIAGDGRFGVNVAITDRDSPTAPEAGCYWWMPDWTGPAKIDGGGEFILEPMTR